MKKSPWRAMIAPGVVTIIILLYFVFYGWAVFLTPANILFKLLACGVPAAVVIAMVYLLFERYKEITGGFNDDLDNY